MKRVFISQPMNGKTDDEIRKEREDAVNSVRAALKEDVEVLDTYFADFNGKPLEFLGKSIMMLAQADVAYFAPGWRWARGCKIEHECALQYGVKIMHAGI